MSSVQTIPGRGGKKGSGWSSWRNQAA